MKKALSFALCVVMLLTAFPMSGFAFAIDEIGSNTKNKRNTPVSMSDSVGDVESLVLNPSVSIDEIDYYAGNTEEELRMPIEKSQDKEPEVDGTLVEVNQYSKVYQIADRTYTAVYGSTPNYFVNEKGNAQAYDNSLTLDAGKKTAFTNTASDIDVRLSTDIVSKGMTFDYNGVKIGLTPIEGNYDSYLVVDDAVRYSNVFDGIDVQYTVGKQGVSEDIILNKEVDKNTFSYKLNLKGHYAKLIDNVLFVFNKKGDADYAYTVSAPIMTDAAGISSENVVLSLKGDILTVTADSKWLHAAERSYPVIIDPEIRIDSSIAIRSVVQDGDRVYVSAVPYAYGYAGYIKGDYFGFGDQGDLGRSKMLIHFDGSALNEIPEGSGIVSASFNIYQYNSPSSSTNFWCSMITDSWNLSDFNSGTKKAYTRASALNLETLSSSVSKKNWHSFDIRTAVNNWFNGLDAQNGLMITSQYENDIGGAFVTNNSAGAAGAGTYAENKPYITITWELPNPVDVNYDINRR